MPKTISLWILVRHFIKRSGIYIIKQSRIYGFLLKFILCIFTKPVINVGRFLAILYTRSFGLLQLRWYDHIYDHLGGPENWLWLERGILASDCIQKDDRVLDLCCGDGSYSGIFFGTKARFVDAVDISAEAIRIAKKRWIQPNVSFYVADVVQDHFPSSLYDVVILNSALEYLSTEDAHKLLNKVKQALSPENGIFFGCTPIWKDKKPDYFGQVIFMSNIEQLEEFLRVHFNDVVLWQSRETKRLIYFFKCK